MLMKWSQVSRDGLFTPPPIPQMAYGALIGGRVAIVRNMHCQSFITTATDHTM